MPKEVIVLHRDVFGQDSAAASLLEVRWGKNGFVELGLRVVHGADHSDYIPKAGEGSPTDFPVDVPIRGRYTSIDRDQINELIRYLRRARDYAFGGDE
jgi:hypothetical protein